jgi:plasmid maintenance system antidote protein VapI
MQKQVAGGSLISKYPDSQVFCMIKKYIVSLTDEEKKTLLVFLKKLPHDIQRTALIKGEIRISVDTALRLSAYLGTTPNLWLNLQSNFDLRSISNEKKKELKNIRCVTAG